EVWCGGVRVIEIPGERPPRWIRNARTSRKRGEPEIVRSLRMLGDLKKNRPRARSAIEHAGKALRAVLNRWEIAYSKENFIAAYVFFWSCSGMVLRIYRWTAAAGV